MFWFIGFGIQHGHWVHFAHSFCGIGRFAVDIDFDDEMGDVFITNVFQVRTETPEDVRDEHNKSLFVLIH